jgi:MSHA biogenesis protein MshM
MYLSHFGLNQSPFGITPNPAFFYSGSKRGDILQALIYAVTHGEGIIKVTGEVGSGKTMLCRMLEGMMPANVEVIYLVNPTLSREEVMFTIAGELEIPTEGKRPDEVIRLLHSDLIAKHINGKQVVLLVEEAQAMPLETLEEIRLFSNLETAHHKLLQIVLFGQPELDESLNLPRMRQLKERITHSFKVPPMTALSIPEFLMFRMRAAGYHGPDIFSQGAIKLLAAVSEGIVRRINILADKSLLAVFSENAHLIEERHVKAAILDSEFSTTKNKFIRRRGLFIALILSVVVIVAIDVGLRSYWSKNATTAAQKSIRIVVPAAAEHTMTNIPPAILHAAVVAAVPLPSNKAENVTPTDMTEKTPVVATVASVPAGSPIATGVEVKGAELRALPVASIFAQRMLASKVWLRDSPNEQFTIQIALIDADAQAKIEQFLKKAASQTEVGQLYLYPTRIGGAARFGVVYSSFVTRDEEREKRIELQNKWGYKAQLRTMGGLRAEIQRSHSEDLW